MSFNQSVCKTFAAAGLLSALAGLAIGAVPTQWTFKIVARDGAAAQGLPAGASLQADPCIDEAGNAYARFTIGFGDGIVRYKAPAGSSAVIRTTVDGDLTGDLDASAGRVAIKTFLDTIEVRDVDGALLYTVTTGGPEGVTGAFARPRLTSDGRIGYRAQAGSVVKHVLDNLTGGPRTQYKYAEAPGTYSFLYSPTANASGQLASRVDMTGGGSEIRLFGTDGSVGTVASTIGNPTFNAVGNGTDLSDAGQVAFYMRRTATNRFELRRGDTSSNVLIADPNGSPILNTAFTNFTPSVNSNGIVAFRCNDANGAALYLGDGDTVHRLMGDGDTWTNESGSVQVGYGPAGSRTVLVGNVSTNNANQVVFIAGLFDGTRALVVASPVTTTVGCQPADIANDQGTALNDPNRNPDIPNGGVNEGDYNCFFAGFFDAASSCDIANDNGTPRAPFGTNGVNGGVNEGDYNCFFQRFFDGCP